MFGNIMGAAGAIGGGLSGGKGGKSSGGMPNFVKRQIKRGYGMLNTAADRPVDQAVAPFNADQNQAMQQVRTEQGFGQDTLGAAQGRLDTLSANGVTPQDIQKFYNPYQNDVINASLADIEQNRAQRRLGANAEAEAAGAFGGDRNAVYNAELDGQYDRTGAMTIAQLRNQGFNTASDLATKNYGLQLQGNQQLAGLIDQRRRAMLGDASALGGIGDAQQTLAQTRLDYPVNMAQLVTNAGTGVSGAQRATAGAGGGIGGALSGAAGGLASIQSILSMFGK